MAYANMTGVDREFTRSTSGPIAHALGYVILPLYLLTSGRGYKAVVGGEIAGCAFLHMRRLSGFVFNVNVNAAYRRKGIGRALMEHLEKEVRRTGRRWVGLHLDDGNEPAQRLYEAIGYRDYHHRFLRSHDLSILQQPELPNIVARALARHEATSVWKRYADLERREGDVWAARVVREDYDEGPPSGGAFWACTSNGEEIGCAWMGGKADWPTVHLLLRSEYWNRRMPVATLLRILMRDRDVEPQALDLHAGSSTHYEAMHALLRDYGFTPRNRARILMLKELEI
jgi:GNAT superfamily N-acetyltransferase